jgi:hypothetical protein
MRRVFFPLICLVVLLAADICPAQQHPGTKQVTVYKELGRFGGWPANQGIWSWGDETLVGFSQAYFKKVERGHAIDGSRPWFQGLRKASMAARRGKSRRRHSSTPTARKKKPLIPRTELISRIATSP